MSARKEALNILYRVMHEGGYASLLMREAKISKEDMPFVTNVVYGVLRNHTYLEYQWRRHAKRTKVKTALALDMAIYELHFMQAKEYAVVNEMVNLVNKNEKNFVNAILRKYIKEGWLESDIPSIKYSHPDWLIGLWNAHYGKGDTLKILEADQQIPRVYGRINPIRITKEELAKDVHVHFIDDLSFTMDKPMQSSQYFKEGKIVIQNPSSIIPVRQLDLAENLQVLDTCAAPGTKTQLISSFMHNTGHVIACDLYAQRCALIEQLMHRCGNTNVEAIVNDAAKPSFQKESFDRILCDVPCSGLGDLSHKPEIRWHLKPEDLDAIVQIQATILEVSSTYLKKGGVLVYSTCTLNKKENTGQVKAFLEKHNDFTLVSESTVFPFEENRDGFYIAKLVKKTMNMVE